MKFSRLPVLFTTAVVVTSVIASTSKAHALVWNLNNVTFTVANNGVRTATGSFDYDPTNGYSLINISYNASTPSSSPVVFSQTSFVTGGASNLSLSFVNGIATEKLDFTFNPQLTNTGTLSVVTGAYNYSDTDGTLFTNNIRANSSISSASASVPFDIPGGATIPAVGGLLALGLMRKARKSLASNTRISEPMSEVVS